jgi:mannose-1-phosphate guanylyltransferase/mannose-6-phosphate isomerase
MPPPIIPVILAGGAGTRLWPVSRDASPKQFLPVIGERSTYQEILLRVRHPLFGQPIIITGPNFHFLAKQQAIDVGVDTTVVIEPLRRDSAPAIAAAASIALARDPQAILIALAADQVILDEDDFHNACLAARNAAEDGFIVTFGIMPTEPRTSYGYILPGAAIGASGLVSKVERFVEKPDAATSARYVTEGYLWNSGNFLFRADTLLSELALFEPGIVTAAESAVANITTDLGFLRLDSEHFVHAPQKSIDYALMEKTNRAAVVSAAFRWSDIGSWDALFDVAPHDDEGNVLHGDVVTIDTKDCIVHSDKQLTALMGVQNLVVVSTADAVMVAPRARAQEVRKLVAKLKEEKRSEVIDHKRVHRPWGYFERLDIGDGFQVKRIVVIPGGVLSLQKHRHRSEHWIVVHGHAEVTVGKSVRTLQENESIFIPIGALHRIANRDNVQLELIEVQTGNYLGEDDIERIEDIYKRG